ncbi:hypothetical protein AAMO2058_001652400 [Amorphochlora amoebiformis]
MYLTNFYITVSILIVYSLDHIWHICGTVIWQSNVNEHKLYMLLMIYLLRVRLAARGINIGYLLLKLHSNKHYLPSQLPVNAAILAWASAAIFCAMVLVMDPHTELDALPWGLDR